MDHKDKKIFFSCSTTDFPIHRKQYLEIIEILKKSGARVISNISLEEFDNLQTKSDYSHYSSSHTYIPTIKKIVGSDMIVIDASVYSMTTGSMVTYALSIKKPVLLLTEKRNGDHQDLFISGNDSPLLYYKVYTYLTLENSIRDFLRKSVKDSNVRLNFVLDKSVTNRLDWLAFRTKQSKTEIVRRAINAYDPEVDN